MKYAIIDVETGNAVGVWHNRLHPLGQTTFGKDFAFLGERAREESRIDVDSYDRTIELCDIVDNIVKLVIE